MKRKNDRPINEVLSQFVQSSDKINRGLAAVTIEQVFREEMGEVVYSYLSAIRLTKGTLIISVLSAPLRTELINSRQKLMEVLNAKLGKDMITKVVVR